MKSSADAGYNAVLRTTINQTHHFLNYPAERFASLWTQATATAAAKHVETAMGVDAWLALNLILQTYETPREAFRSYWAVTYKESHVDPRATLW